MNEGLVAILDKAKLSDRTAERELAAFAQSRVEWSMCGSGVIGTFIVRIFNKID